MLFTQKQGLSSPNIHKIIQDKYGFMWVATQDGLNRFDGTQFIKYNSEQTTSRQLFSPDIRDLVIDNKAGLLWVICNQGGINVINLATGNCIGAYPYPKNRLQDVWRICAASYEGKIFIGTSGGLDVFDMNAGRFVHDLFLNQLDTNFRNAFLSDIRTVCISKEGIIVLGLLNKGVYFYDLSAKKGFLIDRKEIKNSATDYFWPLCSQFVKEDLFYCGTQRGLVMIDYKRRQIIQSDENPSAGKNGPVTAIAIGNAEKILLAGDNLIEVNLFDNNTSFIRPVFYEAESWLKNITSVFQDYRNNIWIGSRQGLCLVKIQTPVFRAIKNNPDRYANKLGHVFSICAVNDSTVLAGTKDGLFLVRNNLSLKQIYNGGLVQNIVRIANNAFIISGYNGARLFINGKMQKLSYEFPELEPYEHWQFNSFVKLNDSVSLLGTESNNGVLEWDTRHSKISRLFTNAHPGKRLPSDIINSIFINKGRKAVLLSDYFISLYDPEKESVEPLENYTDHVNGIYMQMEQTKNNYWVAAYGNGLIKTDLDFKIKKIFRTEDGLTNSGLYSILNYKDSILFLTSNFGISVFDIKTEKFYNYYEEDGLQNNTFEEACRDTLNGVFFAGGAEGYVKIVPLNLSRDMQPPLLYFTKVVAEGSSSIFLDTSNLKAARYSIASQSVQVKIFFSGLHYNNSQRVSYAYRIKELGNYWISLGKQNFIPLIGLSPGTYHLQVKAANEDGVWSEPKELVLIFLPKWYQTWWFYLLIALTVAGILYALYRYRISQIKKQHEIRKNIATDLHDDLGSTLNSVKVFTNLAISGVKQEESLQQIKDNLNEATMGLRDMIWVLDDSLDTVDELVTRLKQFAIPVASASNIQAEIKAASEVNNLKLTKEEKRNLFLVCKEAINNSIKYSGATQIDIDIKPDGKKIRITIADNGKGFDMNTVKKGYGLKNMQYRAGQVKYKTTFVSSPGMGTIVQIQSE